MCFLQSRVSGHGHGQGTAEVGAATAEGGAGTGSPRGPEKGWEGAASVDVGRPGFSPGSMRNTMVSCRW